MRKARSSGFTLMELLVVCIIIVILLGGVVALYNSMFNKDSVTEAGNTLQMTLLDGRQSAATQRVAYFIRFSNDMSNPDYPGAAVYLYRDKDYNKQLNIATDGPAVADPQKMPKGAIFFAPYYPDYIMIEPNGAMIFAATSGSTDSTFPGAQTFPASPTGYTSMAFENNFALADPAVQGDLVLSLMDLNYKVCMDIDPVSGKIRKSYNVYK